MREALRNFSAYIKSGKHYYSLFFDVQRTNIPSKELLLSIGATNKGKSPISIFGTFERFELKL